MRGEIREEDPILKRRDRTPTITVQSEHDDSVQPPHVTMEVWKSVQPIISRLLEATGLKSERMQKNR